MPKLYNHDRITDLEFLNLYNSVSGAITGQQGLPGPAGPEGEEGEAGASGANSTFKILRKYLVSVGYYWAVSDNVAIPSVWTNYPGFPDYFYFEPRTDYDNLAEEYLTKKFFCTFPDLNEYGHKNYPIFVGNGRFKILKMYVHLIESFDRNQPYSGDVLESRARGCFLYAKYGGTIWPMAWSGEPDLFHNADYYPTPYGTYSPGTLLSQRGINQFYWEDQARRDQVADPKRGSGRWYDPEWEDYQAFPATDIETNFGWALGFPEGTEIYVDNEFQTFHNVAGQGGSQELLPAEYFPMGGGCLAITMLYHYF
jgi:hypothetical protein